MSGPCVTDGSSSFRIDGGELRCATTARFAAASCSRADDERVTLTVPRAALSPSGDLIAGGTRGRVDDDDDDFAALFQMIRR